MSLQTKLNLAKISKSMICMVLSYIKGEVADLATIQAMLRASMGNGTTAMTNS